MLEAPVGTRVTDVAVHHVLSTRALQRLVPSIRRGRPEVGAPALSSA
jgi:hypothetical protein